MNGEPSAHIPPAIRQQLRAETFNFCDIICLIIMFEFLIPTLNINYMFYYVCYFVILSGAFISNLILKMSALWITSCDLNYRLAVYFFTTRKNYEYDYLLTIYLMRTQSVMISDAIGSENVGSM